MGNYTGVQLTYAASGSSGITVADNDNIDFGTGNFTLVWNGSIPDWTPATAHVFIDKENGSAGYQLAVGSSGPQGRLQIWLNGTSYYTASAPSLADGTEHQIVSVITRETASVAGSIVFYVDGVSFETKTITAGVPATVNNASPLYVAGYSGVRSASVSKQAVAFNRALAAGEVKSLYENGLAEADKYGSQTSLITGDDSTFASNTGWWTRTANVTIADGVCHFINATANTNYLLRNAALGTPTKKYRVTYTISNLTGGGLQFQTGGAPSAVAPWYGAQRTANGTYTDEIEFYTGSNGRLYITAVTAATTCDLDDVTMVELGATLDLEPAGIELDKWYDNSTNDLDASYPSVGYYLMPKIFSGIYKRRMRIFKKR